MSRTFKDKPYRLKHESWDKDRVLVDIPGYYRYIWNKTTKPKKRKKVDTEDHWMTSGPSWYKNLFMNRPQRRAGRVWEHVVLRQDIEEADAPGVSHKPHVYWW